MFLFALCFCVVLDSRVIRNAQHFADDALCLRSPLGRGKDVEADVSGHDQARLCGVGMGMVSRVGKGLGSELVVAGM